MFVELHSGGRSFWLRVDAVAEVERPLPADEPVPWARAVLNATAAPRYVDETPEEVLNLIRNAEAEK